MAKTPAQRAAKHGTNAALPTRAADVVNPSTSRQPAKAAGNASLILIAGTVASLFLFWYFHLLTLGQMMQLSSGHAMPDSLAGGFDPSYIQQLRGSMGADARGQLQYVHKTAGTLFPLVFGFSAMIMIALNVARKPVRWALWAAPVLFASVQLWANFAVDGMLSAGTLDVGQVALASFLVVASWVLLILSLLACVAALFIGRRRKMQKPKAAAGDITRANQ
ncbi:hypothetical protein [Paenarthrobacter sp. PH39-S1]|uniref:hypothetical protein n=1 Tax=Paenarthrobacter sp. PH39-S1 TaxID=3046204 RepID=UPI0024BADDAA|nr:hypothetical protein [Paenarthrobacter sp. PH39-S1]MDJ0354624.1 hypothetical protein [Paenarthrobacter sp. PH39-S1]